MYIYNELAIHNKRQPLNTSKIKINIIIIEKYSLFLKKINKSLSCTLLNANVHACEKVKHLFLNRATPTYTIACASGRKPSQRPINCVWVCGGIMTINQSVTHNGSQLWESEMGTSNLHACKILNHALVTLTVSDHIHYNTSKKLTMPMMPCLYYM